MKNRKPMDAETKKNRIRGALWLTVFLLAWLAIGYFVGKPLLQFVSEPERLRAWVDTKGIWGRLALVGMMALQVIVAVIPCEALEIAAGYAYGMWEGAFLCLAGLLLGSAAAVLFARKFGMRLVELIYSREKIESVPLFSNRRRLNVLTFFLFLIPGAPKDLLSYLIGLTNMKLGTFLLLTSVARFPSVIISTIGGNALWMHDYKMAIYIFSITVVISLIGLIIYRAVGKRKTRRNRGEQQHENNAGSI